MGNPWPRVTRGTSTRAHAHRYHARVPITPAFYHQTVTNDNRLLPSPPSTIPIQPPPLPTTLQEGESVLKHTNTMPRHAKQPEQVEI